MTTSPYIHPVPVGATIPAGTKYASMMPPWGRDIKQEAGSYQRFTADPIPAPRSVPPTEPGTVLLDVTTDRGTLISRLHYAPTSTCDPCPWLRLATPGAAGGWFRTSDLVSWTVADVVPRTEPEPIIPAWERDLLAKGAPDPLDENDHRRRVLTGRNYRKTRHALVRDSDTGRWQPQDFYTSPASFRSLATWESLGWTIEFADEVQS